MRNDYSPDVRGWDVLDTFPMNVGVLDETGTILYTNQAWREFGGRNDIGMSPDMIGVNYLDVTEDTDDEYVQEARVKLHDVLEGNCELATLEYPCHSPTKQRWFLMRATAFIRERNRYVTVAHFDITDRVLAEKRAEQRREEVVVEREQLALLTQILRHDIRNDVTVVLGWGRLLEEHVDSDGREILQKVLTTGKHIVELTEIARDYVKALGDEHQVEVTPLSLNEVLENEVALRRESFPNATFAAPCRLPEIEVLANEMLASVFRNLLNNAVQHNDADEPIVCVTVEVEAETVLVRIADNGPGIPDERKESVFGRDEKGLESTGAGIGLYLVRMLVTQYGGSVWVENADAGGAEFNVRLLRAA